MLRVFAVVSLACVAVSAQGADIDSYTFGGLKARAIGPAVMSGRIASIDAVAGAEATTIYVGAASGGLWKSRDGGVTFQPIFDDYTQSIGVVRVAPGDPEVVWVGTGESWVRNSVSVGEGVFRSDDGGETWQSVGLENTERIGAIRISPYDASHVFVCATGALWNASPERGVYRSRDAGKTWELVLHVNDDTGCADLDMDPANPNLLFAAMWQFRRGPDYFESGGPGSGLYRSVDGGDSWEPVEKGLPNSDLGRIAVAFAPSRPGRVYANVEAETTALYRSDNLGSSWDRVNDSFNVTFRPFYFSELVIDPSDADRVYKPGYTLGVSRDAGKTFGGGVGGFDASIHPDHHALWVDPDDPNHLLLGTDGGVYVSHDRAAHWRFVGALPVSQFYHVSVDDAEPYNVYGGLQDNGSWRGPSRSAGGVQNKDWQSIGFGDGFWVFADPKSEDHVYAEYQGGEILHVNTKVNEGRRIQPVAAAGAEALRFNWNTPMHLSPNTPGRLYVGSQHVHYTDDQGESWQTISPDLTTDDPDRQRQLTTGGLTVDNSTAENNATLYSISESPLDGQIIWAGSDDGRLHVTADGGGRWRDVFGNLPDAPKGTWVSRVHASPHRARTAFVTLDGHRTGDMATYVYRTNDLGATWTSLATEAIEGYAWVIRQDPVNPELLYLGTEFGLYLTLDGGARWARFRENLPRVAVHDLVVHPQGDLVIGTHGRGVYIIDDLTPLRNFDQELLEQDVALLPSRPSPIRTGGALQSFAGQENFVGENPPAAAVITFYQRKRHLFGDLLINVYDASGEQIASLPAPKRRGMNRVLWPMRLKPPKLPPSTSLVPAFVGPALPEGDYRIELVKGDTRLEGEVTLVADPRSPHDREARVAQQAFSMALYEDLASLTYLSESLADLTDQVRARAGELTGGDARRLQGYAEDLEAFRDGLAVSDEAGILSGQERLREKLGQLYGNVVTYEGRPTATQVERKQRLEADLADAVERGDELMAKLLQRINAVLEKREMTPVERLDRAKWESTQEGGATAGVAMKWLTRVLLPSAAARLSVR